MDTDGLLQLIVQKRELLARETFSRRAFNRCEAMSDEMKNRYVEYLIERLENAELDNRAMKLVLEDLTEELSRSNRMLEKLNELQRLLVFPDRLFIGNVLYALYTKELAEARPINNLVLDLMVSQTVVAL